MEVSRIGSRFYENAAQSGKKVKGKQQDGFAYELQKSYDEKYRSEDTDETGMTERRHQGLQSLAAWADCGQRKWWQKAFYPKRCQPVK